MPGGMMSPSRPHDCRFVREMNTHNAPASRGVRHSVEACRILTVRELAIPAHVKHHDTRHVGGWQSAQVRNGVAHDGVIAPRFQTIPRIVDVHEP